MNEYKIYDKYLFTRHLRIRFSSISLRAYAIVTRRCVLADGVCAAGSLQRSALIQVATAGRRTRVSSELWCTSAREAAFCVCTHSALSAHCLATLTLI